MAARGRQQHCPASLSRPQHVLYSACATPRTRERARAHTQTRQITEQNRVRCLAQASILPHARIPPSCPDKGRERAHARAYTLGKHKASLTDDAYQATPPNPPGSWKTRSVSVQFCHFPPLCSSKQQQEKLTFLVSPWLFLFCGIFWLLRLVLKFPPEVRRVIPASVEASAARSAQRGEERNDLLLPLGKQKSDLTVDEKSKCGNEGVFVLVRSYK